MKTLIIAEAGVNHNGDIDIAKEMVRVAARAGADVVKFQTFKTENLVTNTASLAQYQQINTQGKNKTQFEMLKKLELSPSDHYQLVAECKKFKIKFLSTAFDLESADFLYDLEQDIFKIPSGEITNFPLLRKIGGFNKKIIFSTGMAEISEIEYCLRTLISSGTKKEDISILQCTTEYPTPDEDVNLLSMKHIADTFGVTVGFSDHSLGITMPIAAVALGASIIEKHFTLDKNMEGPDHKASLGPDELTAMVNEIRRVEKGLGSSIKTLAGSEAKNKSIARKSLVAKKNISKGEYFTEDNLITKRPGTGLSPSHWEQLLGRKALKNYLVDEHIDGNELL